jgi:KDO2-lipid IV(A) lauroyltransferase
MGSVPVRPAHAAARASLTALREGRVLTILADEFKSGGVEIEFFGRPASAPRGPVTLAMRSGAALIPVFARRDEHDRLSLHVGREIELSATGNPVKDVAAHTQRIFDEIEREVRAHPDQWSWGNFRARQRPAAPKFRSTPEPRASENAEATARR